MFLSENRTLNNWLIKQAEAEARKKKEEEERFEAEERARRARQPRHEELDIPTLMPDSEEHEIDELASTLGSISKSSYASRISNKLYVFSNTSEEKAEVDNLKKRLKDMKIVSQNKLTSDRIYSSAYHPEKSKDLIFFGGKSSHSLQFNAHSFTRQTRAFIDLGRSCFSR